MSDGGLTQEEIDALLAGTGLDDFEDDDSGKDKAAEESLMDVPQKEPLFHSRKRKRSATVQETLESQNLALLMDVKMSLTVELGRTQLPIKTILRLTEGSVIELDKLSGEPVDILVNDLIIGHGMVVVCDDDYGVQVTHILDPMERFKLLS